MLPKNLVLDKTASPKSFDEVMDTLETDFRPAHEQTTLQMISLRPDATVETPAGTFRVTRDFLEDCADVIEMPLVYAYKVPPELFCENFRRRQADAAVPVTVCTMGDVAIGLVNDRRSRYRPACSREVFQAVRARWNDFVLRRASVSYSGVDLELTRPGFVVEPSVGDVIEVGMAVTNSESGDRQLKAAGYSYRLVCTNGAIMADAVGVARWPNDPRMTDAGCLRSFLRDVTSLCAELQAIPLLYERALDRTVPDVAFVNVWRRVKYVLSRGDDADAALAIPAAERRMLQETIRTREPNAPAATTRWSAYDIHNRITHAAHGRSFRVRRGLQELGGQFLNEAAAWPLLPSVN